LNLPGQIGRQSGFEIAVRQGFKAPAKMIERDRLIRFRLDAFLFELQALLLERFEIHRNGIIHIEHGGLDDCGNLLRKHLALLARKHRRPLLVHQPLDQIAHQQRIAADVPARLETDSGMRLADGHDAIDVGFVEISAGEIRPVIFLALLGAVHM
jgi:hypothetical protein